MDDLTRKLAMDLHGKDSFIDDGFKVVPRSIVNTFKVTPGAGYVSGLRVELDAEHILTLTSYPQFVYIDAYFDGDTDSVWKPKQTFTVRDQDLEDYIDGTGKQHYVYKLAKITAADTVEDLREKFNAQQDSYIRSFETVAEAKADKFLKLGQKVKIVERDNAEFVVVTSNVIIIDGHSAILSDFRTDMAFMLNIKGKVNVKHFGAIGDGVADDDAAINAAVATKKHVRFPAGIYIKKTGIAIHKGQHLYGDSVPQRSNRNAGNASVIKFTEDVWGVNTSTNIALGAGLSNLFLEYAGTSPSTKGAFKAGVKGVTDGGYSQGLKIRLTDVNARGGWHVGFGVYGWSWGTTFTRCDADSYVSIGFDIARAGNIVTLYDCGAILGSTVAPNGVGMLIDECFQVNIITPRLENNRVGIRATGGATVNVVGPYMEGNRAIDFSVKDPKTVMTIQGGDVFHANNGVTTDAVFECRDGDVRQQIISDGIRVFVSAGEAGKDNKLNQLFAGYDNNSSSITNVSWEGDGKPFLDSSGAYAPRKLSFVNLPDVEFLRRGAGIPHRMIAVSQNAVNTSPADSTFELHNYDGEKTLMKYAGSRDWNNSGAGSTQYRVFDGSAWQAR